MAPILTTGAGGYAAIGPAAVTWNPTDRDPDILLSGSNLTLSLTTGGAYVAVRATSAILTNQKVYYEYTHGNRGFNLGCGFANAAENLGARPGAGTVTAFSLMANGGTFTCVTSADNGVQVMPTCEAGDRVGIAYNSQTSRAWFRKNGGTWNVSIAGGAGQDPAGGGGAGSGGVIVVIDTGNPIFPIGYAFQNNDVLTANFGTVAFTDTPPALYTKP